MKGNQFTTFIHDRRGVSEALGYVLLLGVVVFAILAVGTMGGPVIVEQQEEEYMSNTVRAFEVFGNNLKAIERDRAPARETEIRYQGGQLFQNEDFFMQVNVTHDGTTRTHILAGTPVSYVKDGTSVHYEAGTIIREDHQQGVMRTEPPFEFHENRTRMSVVTTTVQDDKRSLSGSGKIALVARSVGTETEAFIQASNPDDVEIEITVVSPRSEVWETYFDEQGLTKVDVNHTQNRVTYNYTTKEFMLRETLVEVEARD